MTLFVDPSFFTLLAVAVAVAAALGLAERPIRRWGLVVSCAVLACALFRTPAQLAALVAFLAVARAAVLWLARRPEDSARFYAACTLTCAPLACAKVGGVFGASLMGFLGISYVTFKALQVVIEVRDGLIDRSGLAAFDWLYFLLFFPQFSSGPIDRSRRFAADAHDVPPRDEYAGLLARGILLILAGALYKVVLAAVCHRFYSPAAIGGGPALAELAEQVKDAYAYGLYLFFDFAGYSLMAMGASYCLGIRCPRNFRAPFVALDMSDFWNRWHITLSTWFRDFVFMRLTRAAMRRRLLGGNRLAIAQCGLVADMLVMGLWHGLTASYVVYGLYHGVLLAATEGLERRSGLWKRLRSRPWFKVIRWFVTLQLVMLGLAIFSGQVGIVVKGLING